VQQALQEKAQTIYDLIRREFGEVKLLERDPVISTIGTADDTFLRASSSRVWFAFVNLSANVMFIRPRRAAATTAGLRAGPNGGGWILYWKEDGPLPSLEWHVIADAGAGNQFFVLALEISP